MGGNVGRAPAPSRYPRDRRALGLIYFSAVASVGDLVQSIIRRGWPRRTAHRLVRPHLRRLPETQGHAIQRLVRHLLPGDARKADPTGLTLRRLARTLHRPVDGAMGESW